jgi:hypothetical protein
MGYYYYGKSNKRVEFEDSNPPKYQGGVVVLREGAPRSIFNELDIKIVGYYDWADMYHVDATIEQLNKLFETGMAKCAEPSLAENIGPRR